MLGSMLESVLRADLEVYSQAGWECAFERNWECLESSLWNVQSSRLGVCHRVQLGAFGELIWERTAKQAGSVPSSAIDSVLRAHSGACNKVHFVVLLNVA